MIDPMLMVLPVMANSTTTPMKPRGMVNMLMNGNFRFSYSEAITAKTSTREISRAKARVVKVSVMFWYWPAISVK